MDKNKVIGNNGSLPWHIPSDLKHFKAITNNMIVIMGRTTFDSLNRPDGLPNRINIVITSRPMQDRAFVISADSIEMALTILPYDTDRMVLFIGGASIYKQVLEMDIIDTMHISEIKESYEGDTKFPDFDESKWKETSCEDKGEFFYKVLTRIRN